MLGDSITNLYLTGATWPGLTGSANAINQGVNSNNTAQMLARLPAILAANPKAIFLLGGVNDITTGLSRTDTVNNIQSMISLCQAAGKPIYVQAIFFVTSNYPSYVSFNNEIDARNALIQAMVASAGGGVTWLNSRGVLNAGTMFQSDGIHPNLLGDQTWAADISAYTSLYY